LTEQAVNVVFQTKVLLQLHTEELKLVRLLFSMVVQLTAHTYAVESHVELVLQIQTVAFVFTPFVLRMIEQLR
jgi:hypothetical protein